MNYTYLDARGLLETLMAPPEPEPVSPIPWELSADWIEFEKTLGNFKKEYVKTRMDLVSKLAELNQKREEINTIKIMVESVRTQGLKDRLVAMLEDAEDDEITVNLEHDCGVLTGKCDAMNKVLNKTDAERYAKFTCFVCMDRLVDLFFDPCGHVLCEACWAQTRDKSQCPGCRTPNVIPKRIFTLS